MKMFYEKDADVELIKGKKIAISSKEGRAFMNTFDNEQNNNYGDAKIFENKLENFARSSIFIALAKL